MVDRFQPRPDLTFPQDIPIRPPWGRHRSWPWWRVLMLVSRLDGCWPLQQAGAAEPGCLPAPPEVRTAQLDSVPHETAPNVGCRAETCQTVLNSETQPDIQARWSPWAANRGGSMGSSLGIDSTTPQVRGLRSHPQTWNPGQRASTLAIHVRRTRQRGVQPLGVLTAYLLQPAGSSRFPRTGTRWLLTGSAGVIPRYLAFYRSLGPTAIASGGEKAADRGKPGQYSRFPMRALRVI